MSRPAHIDYMSRALALAQRARGEVSPNPMVGALLVKKGKIIAEGYHRRAGTPHAEIVALKKLGKNQAQGATLYVTLEPCCHEAKRTPPCVPQIIASGIRRVVIGTRDPNPKTGGNGIRQLKAAGVEVIEGILQETCAAINKPFEKWITTGLPYVTLKAALSLDGKIATSSGESKWISNTLSRRYVQELRNEVDAVLVGAGTVRLDDPLLTVRLPGAKNKLQPAVVVVDATLETPEERRLFQVRGRRVIIATTETSPEAKRKRLAALGAELWIFGADLTGRVQLPDLLKKLGQNEITHLLVEGGGGIFSTFIAQRQVDRMVLCLAPKLLGGQAYDWLPDLNVRTLKEAIALHTVSVKTLGDNILIEATLS